MPFATANERPLLPKNPLFATKTAGKTREDTPNREFRQEARAEIWHNFADMVNR